VADWVVISSLATAGGTLALAGATVGSIRSANRAARAAERSVLAGLRPLLMPSRPTDDALKVGFADQKWVVVPGAGGVAEGSDEAVYLAIAVRNVGTGIAVLHGWRYYPDRVMSGDRPEPEQFRRLARDLYIPVADIGFWQGTFRDPNDPEFAAARVAADTHAAMTVDLLYGDFEGGQRIVTRFLLTPRHDGGWFATVSRHWNIDRPDPR
jgi:hypothetical protein